MLAEHTLSSAHFKRYSYVSPMEIRIIVAVLTKEGVDSIEFSINFIGCTRSADHLDQWRFIRADPWLWTYPALYRIEKSAFWKYIFATLVSRLSVINYVSFFLVSRWYLSETFMVHTTFILSATRMGKRLINGKHFPCFLCTRQERRQI